MDTPGLGRRLTDARNKFNLPPYLSLANFNALQNDSKAATELVMKTHDSGLHQYTKELIDDSLDWGRVDWLCGLTRLPVILKGILTGEDAKEATRHGVKGIVVSNHGARQLDGVPATVRVRKENGGGGGGRGGLLIQARKPRTPLSKGCLSLKDASL